VHDRRGSRERDQTGDRRGDEDPDLNQELVADQDGSHDPGHGKQDDAGQNPNGSLRDRDAAEALTQDCFLHACKAWKGFRGEASIQTWLMRIAVNLVRDASRNRRLQFWKRLQAADTEEIGRQICDRRLSPEEAALLQEQVASIWKATASLPERQKTVFLLRFAQDMTLLEIAGATGLSENAVKVHLYRALRAVRMQMGRSE